MKKFTGLFSIVMIAALLGLPALSATELQVSVIRDQVIGDSLTAAYAEESGVEQSVMVFIEDIDHETVDRGLTEAAAVNRSLSAAVEEYENQAEIEAVQADIMARRTAAKEAYLMQNTAFANQYLDGKVAYISKYSPVIIADLDSVETNQLALNSAVESIELYEVEIAEEQPMTAPMADDYTDADVADYYSMIRASYMISTYDGNGINIGILEEGLPYEDYWQSLGVDYTTNCFNYERQDDQNAHSSLVSLLIHEIAPGADLYWGHIKKRSQYTDTDYISWVEYIDSLEDLVDIGVNIINISQQMDTSTQYSQYDAASKYLDYIAHNYGITIVKSSGNNGNAGISSGGMSYNSIVVGGTNANGVWSDYVRYPGAPSYNTMSTYLATKPDVSAPAGVIEIDNMVDEGTSFSVPQVTALAARLMQVDADLMYYPDAVKAIVMTNVRSTYGENVTTPLSDTNPYSQLGAGIIDCTRAIHTTRGGGYELGAFDPNSANTYNDIQITVPANYKVRVTLASLVNVSEAEANQATNKPVPRLVMDVYYGSQYIISSYVSSAYYYYNNAKIISFTTTTAGTYTVRIRNNSNSTEYIFYAIAWDY